MASPTERNGIESSDRRFDPVAALLDLAVESFPPPDCTGGAFRAVLAEESEVAEAVRPAIAASANSTKLAKRSSKQKKGTQPIVFGTDVA